MKGKIIAVVVIVIAIIALLFIFSASAGNSLRAITDPCARQLQDCNYGCGEGWFAGLCKEGCSAQYRWCHTFS